MEIAISILKWFVIICWASAISIFLVNTLNQNKDDE